MCWVSRGAFSATDSVPMFRAPSVCALTAQIASIRISNIGLQQFFARESRSNSSVLPNFTAETFVEPDFGLTQTKVAFQLAKRLTLNHVRFKDQPVTLGFGKLSRFLSRPVPGCVASLDHHSVFAILGLGGR